MTYLNLRVQFWWWLKGYVDLRLHLARVAYIRAEDRANRAAQR